MRTQNYLLDIFVLLINCNKFNCNFVCLIYFCVTWAVKSMSRNSVRDTKKERERKWEREREWGGGSNVTVTRHADQLCRNSDVTREGGRVGEGWSVTVACHAYQVNSLSLGLFHYGQYPLAGTVHNQPGWLVPAHLRERGKGRQSEAKTRHF